MASEKVKITLQELLDGAFGQCRVLPQNISAEMLERGREAVQDMLDALPTHVTPLWARDQQLIALPALASRITMPDGSIDVISCKRREWRQVHAGPIIDNGTNQTLELPGVRQIEVVGIMLNKSKSLTYTIEHSRDGTTWETLASATAAAQKGVMLWHMVESAIEAAYVRVVGLLDADVQEIFLAQDPFDYDVERLNHESFHMLPVGRPGAPNNFWLDKQADEPTICLWPRPTVNEQFSALAVWRQRHVEEVGELYETLNVPRQWKEGLKSMLAYRIALNTPQIDIGIINTLKPLADEMKRQLSDSESDPGPITVSFGIRGYTR